MKRTTLFFASILSMIQSLAHNSENDYNEHSLVLFHVKQDSLRFYHASHASHYSASQTYYHSVQTTKVRDIKLSQSKQLEIKSIIEKNFKKLDTLSFYRCSDLKIEKCILQTIDGFQINKTYYYLYFTVFHYSADNVQTCQDYKYYVAEDLSIYYNYRIENPQRISPNTIDKNPLIKQIITMIR